MVKALRTRIAQPPSGLCAFWWKLNIVQMIVSKHLLGSWRAATAVYSGSTNGVYLPAQVTVAYAIPNNCQQNAKQDLVNHVVGARTCHLYCSAVEYS